METGEKLLKGLCSAHHRAVHRGELLVERESDGALTFRHADGSTYGAPAAPRPIDAFTKVFSALRQLGFREGGARGCADARARAMERFPLAAFRKRGQTWNGPPAALLATLLRFRERARGE